ncbi:MAG: AmiS/UreI family transporter [Betaproteobacteria bacterium]|nr:AmiS/UreI family transporter [Xanthomonadaceae bacterium]MDE2151578.1 AmiS/UreI family transporter [Betaproteobacteria bacterium]
MLGLVLLYVGAVLCLNGLWLIGQIGDNEIAVIDIFVGGITLLVSLYLAFGPGSNDASIKAAALTLLFTFTYLWVAINRYNGADGRGLGWFCLFVAITAVPVSAQTLQGASTLWGTWLGLCWAAWAFLWLLFFILLVMQKPIGRFVGVVTVLEGILTGWLPGYLLLTGVLH